MELDSPRFMRTVLRSSSVYLTALTFTGCGNVHFEETAAARAGFSFEKEGCSEDRFSQPGFQISQKVDLLIVSDTSASLDVERNAVAVQIDKFIDKLPQGADYQVAVMLAHLRPPDGGADWVGRLFQAGAEPKILHSLKHSTAEIRDHLREKLNNIALDYYGSGGGESGIFSLTTGLTTRLAENKSEGFFRSDAALAVVFVSDENDICVPEANAPTGELDMKELHCSSSHTPEALYKSLISQVGGHSLVIGAIVHEHASEVTEPSDGVGLGYKELVELNLGISTPISNANGISDGLSRIGDLMATRLSLITERRLYKYKNDHQIQVRVNGVLAPPNSFRINPRIPSIQLIEPPAIGSANSDIRILNCEPWVEL